MITTHILATVEPHRLQRAVEGLVAGAYAITLTRQNKQEISGFVRNGDTLKYGVTLTTDRAFSCKDAMFRHTVCKHAVALALHLIRTPQEEHLVSWKAGLERSHIWKIGRRIYGWGRCGRPLPFRHR